MRVPTQITPRTQRDAGGRSFLRNGGSAGTQSQAALGNQLVQAGNALGSVGGLLTEQASQARRFGVMQNFSAFGSAVDEKMTELKRNADPALGNFADQAVANYSNWEDEWLATVPDEFYDEFKTRAADIKANIARDALAFQYESTDNFFRQGVKDQLDASLLALDQDGSLANLDAQRLSIENFINTTTLTEAEKNALRRQTYKAIESVSYKSEVRRGNLELGALGVGSAPGKAVDLLLEFEGAGLENGLDYETNQELLGARVAEAEQIAVEGVGSLDRWAAMPERARAALISLVDDLGELPQSVQQAIASGDLAEVANAIADLGGERRATEAQIALGTADMPEGMLDADPRFANIPYEDRLALRADAEREAAAEQAATQAQAKAAKEASINQLMVGILDGEKGQYEIEQAREAGILTDFADIKRAQDLIDNQNGSLVMTQRMQSLLAAGMTINPASDDDRKMFNAYIGEEGQMALRNKDMDYVQQVLIPAARTAGDLPTETVGLLTGMMRAQDPQQALFALDTLSQLEQSSPEAYNARVSSEVAADVEYWRSIKDYYPQDEVLSSVRGGTTQEERTKVTMLREEAKSLLNDGSVNISGMEAYVSGLANTLGDLPSWRSGDPIMTTGTEKLLTSDFNQLFEREYARDGNETKAKERATAALARVWKVTEVGGVQQLMKYPPELTGYETWNGNHDWITEQGRAELGLRPDQTFQLVSDEQTRAEFQNWQGGAGPRPSYLPVYTDDQGNLRMPLDAQGKPQRIFFEITPEMQAEKATIVEGAKRDLEAEEFNTMYNRALMHSIATGVPIPDDIMQEYEERNYAIP